MLALNRLRPLEKFVLALVLVPQLQNPSALITKGTASIEGSVVRLGIGTPIAGATVELTPVGSAPEGVFRYGVWVTQPGPRFATSTSMDGRFVLPNVPAGAYRLYATQAQGFVLTEYGQRSINGKGRPVLVSEGQRLRDVQLAMTPAGSISGRLVDREGEPVVRAHVQAFRVSYVNGRRTLRVVQSVQTNDLGEYRLFWLPPGSYYIGARIGNLHAEEAHVLIAPPGAGGTFEIASSVQARRTVERGEEIEGVLVSVYYPGTVDSRNASPVELHADEHLGGLDFSMASGRIRGRHVRGFVIDQRTNQPGAGMVVLAPREASSDFPVPSANADRNGFDISGVLPGSYILFAVGSGGMVVQDLEVSDTDVNGLRIGSGPRGFSTFQGRIVVEGDAADHVADLMRLQVKVEREPNLAVLPPPPVPGMAPSGAVSATGDFRLNFLPPGNYRLGVAGMPPNLYLKSARMGNRDLLGELLDAERPPDSPIQITLSSRPGVVQGRVLNEKQQPAAGATVVLVPDPARGRLDLYKDSTTDDSGRFEFRGVAEGNYKVFAWEDVESTAWQNEEFMRPFESRGRTVRVDEAGRHEIEVPMIGPQR
jgi:hypothetical protein